MNESLLYLLLDIACIGFPFLASFFPQNAFYKDWKFVFPAILSVAVFFLIWDYFFTEAGIWGFNPVYLTGMYLINLPIEEVLFFICVPYACIFTYFAIRFHIKRDPFAKINHIITIVLAIALLAIGMVTFGRWYTSVTFILTGLYLLLVFFRKWDVSYIYFSYLAIIPLFLLSNGVLTGSFTEAPIVWYNDEFNLGRRIFTIPVEDLFYGFLLVMLNIQLYRWFKLKYSLRP